MEDSKWYSVELKRRLKVVEVKIRTAENKVQSMSTSEDDFIEEYRKLNLLRVDKKTIQSRIDNMGKSHPGMETITIPKIKDK